MTGNLPAQLIRARRSEGPRERSGGVGITRTQRPMRTDEYTREQHNGARGRGGRLGREEEGGLEPTQPVPNQGRSRGRREEATGNNPAAHWTRERPRQEEEEEEKTHLHPGDASLSLSLPLPDDDGVAPTAFLLTSKRYTSPEGLYVASASEPHQFTATPVMWAPRELRRLLGQNLKRKPKRNRNQGTEPNRTEQNRKTQSNGTDIYGRGESRQVLRRH